MKIRLGLLISLVFFIAGCNNQNSDYSDSSKKNEKWAWFVEKETNIGKWIPLGEEPVIKSGKYTLFFSNGNLFEKGTILKGMHTDTTLIYDIFQNKIKQTVYVTDTFYHYYFNEEEYDEYYQNGEIRFEGFVKNHQLTNNWVKYYPSGYIETEKLLDNGEGYRIDYFDSFDSQIKDSIHFQNGRMNGVSKYWYNNGQIKEISKWENGKQHGLFSLYFRNGSIQEKANWISGKRDGELTVWYDNGQIEHAILMKEGKENGYMKKYYKDGGIMLEGNYIYGNKEGEFIHYFENGQIKAKLTLKSDRANGETKIYDEKGKLLETKLFKNDKLIKSY